MRQHYLRKQLECYIGFINSPAWLLHDKEAAVQPLASCPAKVVVVAKRQETWLELSGLSLMPLPEILQGHNFNHR